MRILALFRRMGSARVAASSGFLFLISVAVGQSILEPWLEISPDGSKIAVVEQQQYGEETTLRIEDNSNGEVLAVLKLSESINTVSWAPNSTELAVGGLNLMRIYSDLHWDSPYVGFEDQLTQLYEGNLFSVYTLSWSPDGHLIAASSGSLINIWNVITGERERVLDGSYINPYGESDFWPLVTNIDWLDSTRLIYSTLQGTVYVYSLLDERVERVFQAFPITLYYPSITASALSTSHTKYAVAERDANLIYVWNIESKKRLEDDFWAQPNSSRFDGYGDTEINAVAWRHDDGVLAGLGDDYGLYLWDTTSSELIGKTTLPPDASTNWFVWSTDGDEILYLTLTAEVRRIDVESLLAPPTSEFATQTLGD